MLVVHITCYMCVTLSIRFFYNKLDGRNKRSIPLAFRKITTMKSPIFNSSCNLHIILLNAINLKYCLKLLCNTGKWNMVIYVKSFYYL